MPRNASGVYSLPPGYLAVSGTTVQASQHNTPLEDIKLDLNTARPIVTGGTGASTAAAARGALEVGPLPVFDIDVGSVGAAGAYSITNLSEYKRLIISGYILTTSVSTGINLRLSSDNGATFSQSANDYVSFAFDSASQASGLNTSIGITDGGTAARGFKMDIDFFNSNFPTSVCGATWGFSGGVQVRGGQRQLQVANNALQFFAGSGSITAGRFIGWGFK